MGKKLPYKYNLKKSKVTGNEKLFYECIFREEDIPSSADLRKQYAPIQDQGKLGACTAFSACSVLEYLLGIKDKLSELYFYYEERKLDGDVQDDNGSTIARSAEIATTVGTCLESLCPYDIDKFKDVPTAAMDLDAKKHKAIKKYKITSIKDLLYCVGVLKKPVLIGVDVYDSFEDIGHDGYVQLPKQGEELLGGHAINICGYFYKKNGIIEEIKENVQKYFEASNYENLYFIARNSWGEDFGDKGYIYIPAKFLQKYSHDWWHIDLK
ncbi:C1 family peptidase [Clostridium felsineum]|uniref:C1 family peptidase n=1 Tax=Clostridium felsineum TaxID=36839 RepID=UPI00098CA99F|nr:C1 family peptidase [Clostridium felsineum]MCR3760276.1 C1 family peptidase [Clostridium felsineum]URZ17250.1 hypothetical protein CLFE_033030 [Clostridium felsineum DSM 794]